MVILEYSLLILGIAASGKELAAILLIGGALSGACGFIMVTLKEIKEELTINQ